MALPTDLSIRFRYVHNGQNVNFFRQKGTANRQGLTLTEEDLSYDHIIDSTTRDNRLALVSDPQAPLGEKMKKGLNDQVLILETKLTHRSPAFSPRQPRRLVLSRHGVFHLTPCLLRAP
jgi:hypothetical protein